MYNMFLKIISILKQNLRNQIKIYKKKYTSILYSNQIK